MTEPVVVVGAGAAGLAAALTLAAHGQAVRIVAGGSGASSLSTGALDRMAWDESGTGAGTGTGTGTGTGRGRGGGGALGEEAARRLEWLGLHRVPSDGVLLATVAGILRPAAGADRALLDLKSVPRGTVLVPRCDHHGWDGDTLARSWSDSDIARTSGLSFLAADTTITRWREDHALCDADMAALHDDPARLDWLAERLREALSRGGSYVAVLLPPWLGIDAPRAESLAGRVGIPCGEAVSALAGPAGQRFDQARNRALARANIPWTRAWVKRVHLPMIELEESEPLTASAVILAAGGLVGGGLAYEPRLLFRTTVDVGAALGAYGRPLDAPGSLFGAPPESLAWPLASDPLMDRVGILVDDHFRVQGSTPNLFACGDLLADRPRTWLEAWASGVAAAQALLRPQRTTGPLPTNLSRSNS